MRSRSDAVSVKKGGPRKPSPKKLNRATRPKGKRAKATHRTSPVSPIALLKKVGKSRANIAVVKEPFLKEARELPQNKERPNTDWEVTAPEKVRRGKHPPLELVHSSVKGRLRMRSRALVRNAPLAVALENELRCRSFVTRAGVNPLTGSVLILYFSSDSPKRMVELVSAILESLLLEKLPPREAPSESRPGTPQSGNPLSLPEILWHQLSEKKVLGHWGTEQKVGLTEAHAQQLLVEMGSNTLPAIPSPSNLSLFLDQFKNLPVALLLGSSALSLFTAGVADAVIMLGVVVANAAIGYGTESRSRKTVKSLSQVGEPTVMVVREGEVKKIACINVVPGDLLILTYGCAVAADARLLQVDHLTVDESALTGESVPVLKETGAIPLGETPLADRKNMVYRGTVVTGGSALAIVIATGSHTEFGRIHHVLGSAEQPETPLQKQLHSVGNHLVAGTCLVCVGVFGLGILRRYPPLEILRTAVSLAVAALPEGLPAIATSVLAMSVIKMRKHNILVRKLDAIETLGAIQVVCFDKTGTITMNRMSVTAVSVANRSIRVTSNGLFDLEETAIPPSSLSELPLLAKVAVLCNECTVEQKVGLEKTEVRGSATESALMHFGLNLGVDLDEIRGELILKRTEYRTESRPIMATLHERRDGSTLCSVKGSPGPVLEGCQFQLIDGKLIRLTKAGKRDIARRNLELANQGLRVLGLAYEDSLSKEPGLVWLGLVGLRDPVRNGVKELVGKFHGAGIETVMLTGDQRATAEAIANELNLSGDGKVKVADSHYFTDGSINDFGNDFSANNKVHVFSRVTPVHKLEIVRQLQRMGKIVAMTGDGINDGPALKASDVGVAMGAGGTEMARDVGDVVLKDDDLSSLVTAIAEGRALYDNIRKSIHYIISTNLSEVLLVAGSVGFGFGHPLNPLQLLWINLVSDVFPALALAVEPPDANIMNRRPRDPNERILGRTDAKRIGVESALMAVGALAFYGYGVGKYGMGPQARALAFTNLTTSQLLHALSSRHSYESGSPARPANPYLKLSVVIGFGLQAVSIFAPGVRGLLGTQGVSLIDLALCQLGGAANFALNNLMRHKRSALTSMTAQDRPIGAPEADERITAVAQERLTTRINNNNYLTVSNRDTNAVE